MEYSSIFNIEKEDKYNHDNIILSSTLIFKEDDVYQIYLIPFGFFVKHQVVVIWNEGKAYSFSFVPKLRFSKHSKKTFVALESPSSELGIHIQNHWSYQRIYDNPIELGEKAAKINRLIYNFTKGCEESHEYMSSNCEGKLKRGVKYQLHYDYDFELAINNCGNLLSQIFPEILPHLGCMHRLAVSASEPTLRIAGRRTKKKLRRIK